MDIYGHPAQVSGLDTDEYNRLMGLVRDVHAYNPEAVGDAFLFRATISNTRLDSWFTRMDVSSLRNYAVDATEGRALQNSHKWHELPLGRSVEGIFVDGDTPHVNATFYTVRNLTLGSVNTNDLIRGIEAGIISDVSIGFVPGSYRCSVCGKELFEDGCRHIPGLNYEKRDGDKIIGRELAFAWVHDARLSEVSAVYDGATPGAAILKAERAAQAGWLIPEQAQLLEARYRVKLPGARHTWAGTSQIKEEPMDLIERLRAALSMPEGTEDELIGRVNQMTEEVKPLGILAERANLVDGLQAQVVELTALRAKVATLEPLAADGAAYRTDLVNEALAQGVRAYGNTFDAATYRAVLEGAPLGTIKRMRDDFARTADTILVPGRATVEKTEPKAEPITPNFDRAFAA